MAPAARVARGQARLHGELKWGALLAAEAFILPSHQQNFGIAVAEALAVGTRVLCRALRDPAGDGESAGGYPGKYTRP